MHVLPEEAINGDVTDLFVVPAGVWRHPALPRELTVTSGTRKRCMRPAALHPESTSDRLLPHQPNSQTPPLSSLGSLYLAQIGLRWVRRL